MSDERTISTILNEDGTESTTYPKNPLIEKWDATPPLRHGHPCSPYLDKEKKWMNYTCVICHNENCRFSDDFVVPDEDKEVYEKWRRECDEYDKIHNPKLYSLKHGDITEIEKLLKEMLENQEGVVI